MPGYWDLQAQYGPSLERGVRIGSTIADAFMAGRQRRQQEKDRQDAEQAAKEAEAAQSREAGYQTGIMSQDPIQQEAARNAYRRADPIGLAQFEMQLRQQQAQAEAAQREAMAKQERVGLENEGMALSNEAKSLEIARGPKKPGPELDPIGKRIILESGYQVGTPEYQRRYSYLAAQAEREAKMARDAASAGELGDYTMKLRTEFQRLPAVKNMNTIAESFGKISGVSDSSPAGQMSLVFNYMKMLDPESVVRESEYAKAENAANVPDKVRNVWNKMMDGQFLNPNQVKDFKAQAEKAYAAQFGRYKSTASQYERMARKAGVDPADVVLDVYGQGAQPAADLSQMSDEELAQIAGGQ